MGRSPRPLCRDLVCAQALCRGDELGLERALATGAARRPRSVVAGGRRPLRVWPAVAAEGLGLAEAHRDADLLMARVDEVARSGARQPNSARTPETRRSSVGRERRRNHELEQSDRARRIRRCVPFPRPAFGIIGGQFSKAGTISGIVDVQLLSQSGPSRSLASLESCPCGAAR